MSVRGAGGGSDFGRPAPKSWRYYTRHDSASPRGLLASCGRRGHRLRGVLRRAALVQGHRSQGVGRRHRERRVVRSLASFFTVVFAGAYTTVLHSLAGQTIGKMIVGVRVVGGDDGPPAFGAALLRFIAYFASAAPLTPRFVTAWPRCAQPAPPDLT